MNDPVFTLALLSLFGGGVYFGHLIAQPTDERKALTSIAARVWGVTGPAALALPGGPEELLAEIDKRIPPVVDHAEGAVLIDSALRRSMPLTFRAVAGPMEFGVRIEGRNVTLTHLETKGEAVGPENVASAQALLLGTAKRTRKAETEDRTIDGQGRGVLFVRFAP